MSSRESGIAVPLDIGAVHVGDLERAGSERSPSPKLETC